MTRQKYTINQFKTYIKNKKITLVGIGISNSPLIDFFCKNGAKLTARDRNPLSDVMTEKIEKYDIKAFIGENYLDNIDEDIIIKSPGIRPDKEEFCKGAVVTSEMQLFFDMCPAKIIGITGSDGKTTTTTLISCILKDAGYKVWLGGNIGKPLLCEVENISPDDFAVVELSSFQLMAMTSSPEIAVITNLSENHLDWHKDFNEYVQAKKAIYKYSESSTVILNYDNPITRDMGKTLSERVRYFSRLDDIKDGKIYCMGNEIIKTSNILLPGNHNVENYQAAIAATYDFVTPENVENIAKSFNGVPHRCEFVRENNGVKYYNSSIDSSPSRTIAALKAFNQKIIVICGGYDKNLNYDPLAEIFDEKVKAAILTGSTAEKINTSLKKVCHTYPIYMESTLENAITKAHNIAVPGDIVILSPASASFDAFKNFEERGDFFKQIVNKL